MTHVVIVGSGFAGCTAVRQLRKGGYGGAVTVVSPRPELFFYPSLIWVPAGRRAEQDLRVDLRGFLAAHGVDHLPGSATGLDTAGRILHTDVGDVAYDYLIIASGGRYLRKLPGIERAHIACAGWQEVKAFSDALWSMDGGTVAFGFAGNPNEPSAMRGGPIFEFMFGVDTLLRQQQRRDRFELVFFSPAPKPGKRMGEKAVESILQEVDSRGIERHFGHKLKAFEADRIVTGGGEFRADLILFIPGLTGPEWLTESALALSDGGFVQADAHCRAVGAEGVYVAGDAGSFPGPEWKPKQAHMADLQAECAVMNLQARLAGRPETQTFKTELLCIVDSLNTGSLVFRGERRNISVKMPPMHWAKVFFEKHYLRPYRKAR